MSDLLSHLAALARDWRVSNEHIGNVVRGSLLRDGPGPRGREFFRLADEPGIAPVDGEVVMRRCENAERRMGNPSARSLAEAEAALAARDEENHALRAALEVADREASVAHDAIWDDTVRSGLDGTGFEVLHDSALHTSANAAICRLHDTVRSALAVSRPAQTDTEETRA